MIGAVLIHVDVDIGDGVWVMECGSTCWIQLKVALLVQLLELLKLLFCWLWEHVYHWFNLLSDLSRVVELHLIMRNHSRLKLLLHLILWKEIDRAAWVEWSSLITRYLVIKAGHVATTRSGASCIIVHRVCFFRVICVGFTETTLVFIWTLVDVEIGTSRQTSTFDFRTKELTDGVVSHLLYSKLAWLVRGMMGHVRSIHLVHLWKWVGNICAWSNDAAIIGNIRYYCRVATTRSWGMRNVLLVYLMMLGMLAPLLIWSRRFRRLKCL